jgi:ribonuclease P protein component
MAFACACAPAPGAPSFRLAVAGAAPASPADQHLTSRQVLAKAARRGVRCGRPTLVLHMLRTDNPPSRAGFVVSKAVGNAVRRNRVKRQLRHLVAARLNHTPFAVDVVVRALPESGRLADDLAAAWTASTNRLVES